jgi:hypothetical protein
MRQPILLDPFVGVGAGQRATLAIAPGFRMHGLALRYVSTLAAGTAQTVDSTVMTNELSLIELKIGNKVQRKYTGETLIMLNKFAGSTINNNFLQIPFSEKDRNTINGEEALAWGTANLKDPAVELQVTIASGKYPTTLQAYVEQDDLNLPIGGIVKIYETEIPVSGTGWSTWKPDISRGDKIRRVHIKDSGNITEVEVLANQRKEYQATAAYNTERLKQADYVPQTNWFHIAHDINHGVLDNMDVVRPGPDGSMRLLNSLMYRLNFAATGNFTAVVETIGPPD